MKLPQIYAICIDDVERYIGKTSQELRDRLSAHLSRARSGEKSYLFNLLRKAFREGRKITIKWVDEVQILEEWGALEAAYIQAYREDGYELANTAPGGEGVGTGLDNPNFGKSLTLAHRGKIGNARRGKKRAPFSPEWCNKLGKANIGRKKTPEEIEKLRAANAGKKLTPEHIEKLRVANIGKKLSAETRKKMSVAGKGREFSGTHRANLSAAQVGRLVSVETRDKIGRANAGRSWTEERREANYLRNARRGPTKNSSSGLKGVSLTEDGTWCAQIMVRGNAEYLGVFKTRETAGRVVDAAALRLIGPDTYLNYP